MNKQKLKTILIQLGVFVIQVLLSRIELFGVAGPVGFPFVLVRIFYGHNIFIVIGEYVVSKLWCFKVASNVLTVAFELVVCGLYYFSLEFIKTKKQRLMLLVFVFISKVLNIYFSILSIENVCKCLILILSEFMLALYYFKLFEVFKNKFIFFKFSNFDYLIFGTLVFLLTTGMFSFLLIQTYCGLFVSAAVLIFALRILPEEKFYVLVGMFSVAVSLVSGEIFYLLCMTISSMILLNFRELNKWWYAVVLCLLFAGIVGLLKIFNIISYFSFIFAVFLFLITPQRWMLKWQCLFEQDTSQMILLTMQENKVEAVKSKLEVMASTFEKMKNDLKMLLVGNINRKDACHALIEDVVDGCCKDCENFKFCFMQNINKKAMLENILAEAVEKCGVRDDNLNNGLQTYCIKKSALLSSINQTAKLYLSYEKAMKSEDQSKLVIASEFSNFSDIFLNFAKIINNNAKINKKSSKWLKECIFNALIDVKEVMIFEDENGVSKVCVVSENENLMRRELLWVVEKVVKNKMCLKEIKHLEFSGLGMAVFEPAGRFRLEVAVASKSKERKNGDNVVVAKISETKYFVALADGMGHGEGAHKISSMVLSLVKSMFEVGLDDELVVESVNKLLLPAGLDNFSTLDACVIDLEKEVCNFVKLGSSVSVIKHKSTSELISSTSLPIGVVQNIRPTITKRMLNFDDFIFLASDGVVDSFASPEEFKIFINDTKIYNLQQHLDNIIFDAEYQSKHLDDMTIIGINLLKN